MTRLPEPHVCAGPALATAVFISLLDDPSAGRSPLSPLCFCHQSWGLQILPNLLIQGRRGLDQDVRGTKCL